MPLPESVFTDPFFPSTTERHRTLQGASKREVVAALVFVTLMRNGIYSEGEAVRYADLLLRALATTPPHDPQVPPA